MTNRSALTTPFRLFVLGDLPPTPGDAELVSLAEYRQARALSRIVLRAADIQVLRTAILDLRSFIESGSPVLEQRFLKDLGSRLFDLVIRTAIRDLFVTATAQRDGFVPFELFVESSALASWPWEYLFDTGTGMFVCREFHPISRSIFDQTLPITVGVSRARLRLLVVIGSDDDDEIDAREEVELLKSVFGSYLNQDRFDIVAEPMSARELTTRLQTGRGQFDIVHFLGHSGFDVARGEGYLRLKKARAGETTRLYANEFAQAAADSRIRLAFLNACETARAAVAEDPARSSVAAALLGRGVPAVVAHQFSVPDNGAHFFAGVFYDVLSAGRPLVEAVRAGRAAMGYAEDGRFFDWGIPVLYTRDPQAIVFPDRAQWSVEKTAELNDIARSAADAPDRSRGPAASASGSALESVVASKGAGDRAPSAPAAIQPADSAEAMGRPVAARAARAQALRVAIVDIDARAGFLAAAIEAANQAQRYYQFRLAYLPVPSGAVRKQVLGSDSPQLFIPALEDFAAATPAQLDSDRVCFITRNPLAGRDGRNVFWNHIAAELESNPAVSFISTADLREFARVADTTFAKATLLVCLSMLVASDRRWKLEYHHETVGCLMDYCENRSDVIVGLKKMRFDHAPCRAKIKDREMLAAIDAIVALRT